MAKLRSLSTAFWSDPFIEDLTPNQKLLFLYLITNERTNMLGIYESSIKKISFETGIRKEDVLNGLKAFERLGKVNYINNYVILTNYMKHQNYNTNMKKSAIDAYNNLPKELKNSDLSISKNNPSEGFETLLNHFGMVRKVEDEYEEEREDECKSEDNTFSFKKSLLDLGIQKQLVSDWLAVRKTKRATNTQTAFNLLVSEIEKSGLEANECIRLSIEKSWAGFKAEWLNNTTPSQPQQNKGWAKSSDYSDEAII